VLAQPTKYRNRNLEKVRHQMSDGTDFVVMPQLSDSSVYSQCSVDTKGRTRWEREAQEMFPEIVDQPQGGVGRDGGLACASKIDDDPEKEVQRLAWLQFRQYSHRLQKQEERYEGRKGFLAPTLDALTVEEKAHGRALTKRREMKELILTSKRAKMRMSGSPQLPQESFD
jgi:hypothetical protein